MRLVCPNCGAQYEVDDRVMPDTGRDVQCSNCGHAWFQQPPHVEEATAHEGDEPAVADEFTVGDIHDQFSDQQEDEEVKGIADVVTDDADDTLAADSETDVEADENALSQDASDDVSEDEDADEDSDESTPIADLPQRELNEGVRSVLQEEADREIRAREAEIEQIETQTDLGLDDAESASDEDLKSRVARLREHEDELESPVSQEDLKGRDVLPDIEEINSTLDAPENDPGNISPDDPMLQTNKGGGFRRGFVLSVALACLLAVLYIFAPAISDSVPQAKPVLDQYITIADQARLGLEEMMRSAISKMQGLIDKPENG